MQEKVSLSEHANRPQPGDVGWVPPVTSVKLPSGGVIYGPESPLFGATHVDIRAMTAREEDILMSPALLRRGTALSALMKACVTNRLVDPDAMVVGDRNAIMVAIRVSGYGHEYPIEIQCQNPECRAKSKDEAYDLRGVVLRELGAEPVKSGQNEFAFSLPVTGKTVVFKLLTGLEERRLGDEIEAVRKVQDASAPDPAMTMRLHAQVVRIGTEQDRNVLLGMVQRLPAADSRALRSYIERISPSVEMVHRYVCKRCDEEQEVDVPIGTEFFWPRS